MDQQGNLDFDEQSRQNVLINQYQQNQHLQPCPSCGRCPTCGRGGYQSQPYWHWPTTMPQITYTIPQTTTTGSYTQTPFFTGQHSLKG